jgi:hypothetical protein
MNPRPTEADEPDADEDEIDAIDMVRRPSCGRPTLREIAEKAKAGDANALTNEPFTDVTCRWWCRPGNCQLDRS